MNKFEWSRSTRDPPLLMDNKVYSLAVSVYRWSRILRDPPVLLNFIVPTLLGINLSGPSLQGIPHC